jgi:Wiskott-Aldrich syndrome protein
VDGDRDALLASIRGAGLGSLKKVDKSQLDRPSVLLQEQRGETPPTSAGGAPGGAPSGSLADALAAALNQRKAKVSHSDDESDGEEW